MANKGTVYLVGAGPGDPDLLTVKALRLLGEADVVVYDRLVSSAVLELVPPGTMRIFAGKIARGHHVPQEEINARLVALARRGRAVVRLKGGDPFIFGRGGEEALHLAERGIPFEVVPGITAAVGCAAAAGIPLTHRGLATGVYIVTGHWRDGLRPEPDWPALADPDTTLVIYMGRTNAETVATQLIGAGRPAATPVAVVYSGTLPEQRVVTTRLDDLSRSIADDSRSEPTLIVVGRVVGLARLLAALPEASVAGAVSVP